MTDIPCYSVEVDDAGEPQSGVQYGVLGKDGKHYLYGDQGWVASGQAIEDAHPGGRIQRRTFTITYGEWTPDA